MSAAPAIAATFQQFGQVGYDVAIDTRVNTRLKFVSAISPMAEIISSAVPQHPRTGSSIFFSYRYAEMIKEYVAAMHPQLRLALQPCPAAAALLKSRSLVATHFFSF